MLVAIMSQFDQLLKSFQKEILTENVGNEWFIREYWPGNLPRLKKIAKIIMNNCSKKTSGILVIADIGCGCGYMSRFFARLGFSVIGVDGYIEAGREAVFQREKVGFRLANFNKDMALNCLEAESADIVVCGEVLEHIFHHPAGFLAEISRICKRGGIAIITTPNPATVMNAVRMLRGGYSLWGTREFIELRKYQQGEPIDHGGIHYREYLPRQLQEMVSKVGFRVMAHHFIGSGSNRFDGRIKRWIKKIPGFEFLMKTRLFGSGQIVVCQKQ